MRRSELFYLYSLYIDLDHVTAITGKRPSHFRLPDGTEITVKRWKDVLRESCKFALLSNPNITIPFPDRSGKKVALFSTIKPATGISYRGCINKLLNRQWVCRVQKSPNDCDILHK